MPDKSQATPHDAYFEDLLVRYLDNQLSPGELGEFQTMLAADPARCEQLAAWAHQAMLIRETPQACLMEFVGDEPVVDRVSRPDPDRCASDGPGDASYQSLSRSRSRETSEGSGVDRSLTTSATKKRLRRPMRWGLGLVALAAVVAFCIVLAGRRGLSPRLPPGQEVVARLTDTLGCSWGTSVTPQPGQSLGPGRLDLVTGVAEITFRSGATLLLEGPAEVELVDGNRGILYKGRALVKVPEQARGFSLNTPTTSIVDLGTEFGVALTDSGSTAVQVYAGKVMAGRHSDRGPKRELTAGEAMEFDGDPLKTPRPVAFAPDRFLRELPADDTRGKEKGVPYNVSRYDTLHVLPAPRPVVVDGELGEWDLSGGFEVRCQPPYGEHYYVRGYMLYDAEYLYLGAQVGDPRPMRNSVFPDSEQTVPDLCWRGGSIQVWLSTDRVLGWPVEAYLPVYAPSGNDPQQAQRNANEKLVGLILWYYRPEQRPCLQLAYGMDRHRQTTLVGPESPAENPRSRSRESSVRNATEGPRILTNSATGVSGWRGAFREHADGRGYVMEYAVPWKLLSAADDPPRGGDVLAGLWMVHWSDAAGRIWKGHVIEGRRPGIPGHPHMQAATWGRMIYHQTGNLPPPAGDTN